MKLVLGLLSAMIMVVAAFSAPAEGALRFEARVGVSVSADEHLKASITSYVNRELRSLQDVEIVESDPQWELEIMAMEVATKDGRKTGIVLSVLLLSRFSNKALLYSVPDSKKEAINKHTSGLYYYPDHWLKAGSTGDLKKLCDEIVADFDTRYLEGDRKAHRELFEKVDKAKQSERRKP